MTAARNLNASLSKQKTVDLETGISTALFCRNFFKDTNVSPGRNDVAQVLVKQNIIFLLQS
ncbi:MAG: hypothetical protein ACK56I_34010, partial [bacterium]